MSISQPAFSRLRLRKKDGFLAILFVWIRLICPPCRRYTDIILLLKKYYNSSDYLIK
jgi:hypothetical protein